MSTGPIGGAPVPSIRVPPRRISLSNGPSPSARGGDFGIGLGSSWDSRGADTELSAMKKYMSRLISRVFGGRFHIYGLLPGLELRTAILTWKPLVCGCQHGPRIYADSTD